MEDIPKAENKDFETDLPRGRQVCQKVEVVGCDTMCLLNNVIIAHVFKCLE